MKKILFCAALSALSTTAKADSLDFAMGKALFDRPWTSAPAVTQATDGLGPLFNARSCVACHPKNGRGVITKGSDGKIGGIGYVVRIGNSAGDGDPTYGRQLQTNSVQGQKAEGRVYLNNGYYEVKDLAYGPMAETTKIAGRLSQPLHGLGLLEQISPEVILSYADPDDKNGDGISGRPHMIDGKIGRFAWKATATTLRIQAGNAFSNDIGMSTPVHPQPEGDCTARQPQCLEGPHGNSPQFENLEIDSRMLNVLTVYLQRLPAPKHSPEDGLELFKDTGCAACHIPALPLPNGQKVHAYTDLLLHDMGEMLADGIKEGDASGSEWRTQPLWGTKNTKRFLHDGRAANVTEAISFHDGEARQARENFQALSKQDKNKLLGFVGSL